MFGVQDILVVLFVAGALWYVVRFIRRAMSGKGGCHCEQGSPCGEGGESAVSQKRGIRRVPLVTLSPVAGDQADSAEPPGSPPPPIQTPASPAPGSE